MNNNQFKRFIREKIELYCTNNGYITIYIDTTTNNRVYYIYDKNYKIKATLDNWIGNKDFSIRASYNKTQVVNIVNKDIEFHGTYMELDKLIKSLKIIIDNIGKLDENSI